MSRPDTEEQELILWSHDPLRHPVAVVDAEFSDQVQIISEGGGPGVDTLDPDWGPGVWSDLLLIAEHVYGISPSVFSIFDGIESVEGTD